MTNAIPDKVIVFVEKDGEYVTEDSSGIKYVFAFGSQDAADVFQGSYEDLMGYGLERCVTTVREITSSGHGARIIGCGGDRSGGSFIIRQARGRMG